MTTLAEAMDRACYAARGVKTDAVRERDRGGPEGTDISSSILVFRGGHMVALVMPEHIDRDLMLAGVDMCAFGFSADVIAVVQEAYFALGPEGPLGMNPLTGKPWQNGEMGDVAENHQGRERGWVTDTLLVFAANRAGDVGLRTLPYRVAGADLEWLEDPSAGKDDALVSGYIPEFVREVMAKPTLMQDQIASPMAAELGIDVALAHQDLAMARFLGDPPGDRPGYTVALSAEPGTVRAQIFQRRAEEGLEE